MDKVKVYVAGPYRLGDVAVNVRIMVEVCDRLADLGFIPFCPLLTHFWHIIKPRPADYWLDYDNEWLPLCDCLFRIAGESVGADAEIALALKYSMPVFYDIESAVEYYADVLPQRTQ